MEVKELINSGNLEAYVCGILSPEESREIAQQVSSSNELKEEVARIEEVYFRLAAGIAPKLNEVALYDTLRAYVKDHPRDNSSFEWKQYLGWAAALILFLGSSYLLYQNNEMNQQLVDVKQTKDFLNNELENVNALNTDYQEALTFIKDPNTVKVNLDGQGSYTTANAVAFHNEEKNKTYIDISSLPAVPQGMTYQLWSLTLNPLTPSNMGVMAINETMFLEFDNNFEPQAFGITIEPAGGSDSPTLEKLTSLGVIQ